MAVTGLIVVLVLSIFGPIALKAGKREERGDGERGERGRSKTIYNWRERGRESGLGDRAGERERGGERDIKREREWERKGEGESGGFEQERGSVR